MKEIDKVKWEAKEEELLIEYIYKNILVFLVYFSVKKCASDVPGNKGKVPGNKGNSVLLLSN